MNLSPFEKKCLSLRIGYDHDVCDGKYCERTDDMLKVYASQTSRNLARQYHSIAIHLRKNEVQFRML